MFKSVLGDDSTCSDGDKKRSKSSSPVRLTNTKKRKVDDDDQDFVINSKPDYDNVLMESCYKVPFYRSPFLEHRTKEKNIYPQENRYFSKKYRAGLLQDTNLNRDAVSISNNENSTSCGNSVEIRAKKYNEDLLKDPTDINMWFSYIQFQEEKLKHDMKSKEIKSAVDKRMLNEIKMAVVDEALKKNPRNLSLSMLRIEIGEILWERERVEKCWKDLIPKGRFDIFFWRKYVDYMRRKYDGFTVGKILETYKECFRYLRAQVDNNDLNILTELSGFLWELLEFMEGAGHCEACTTIYQLMFELNLNIPENLRGLPFPDKLDFLSAYWSGFHPKFGEDRWVGWSEWVETMGGSIKFTEPWSNKDVDEEAEFKLMAKHHGNRPESWLSVESYRSSRHWCSWRPDREEDEEGECCEDEDRIVSFEDVFGFLFYANEEIFKFQLAWKFLDYLSKHSRNFCFGNSSAVIASSSISYTSFKEVFRDSTEFCAIEENLEHADKMIGNVYEVVKNKFKGHHGRLFLHRYVEHVIHSEGRQKEVRKIFKKILREHNEDIDLWMKYARFERVSGNAEVFDKVIETSLANVKNLGSPLKQSNELLIMRCKIDSEVGFRCSLICRGCLISKGGDQRAAGSGRLPDSNEVLKSFHWLIDSKVEGAIGILQIKKVLEKKLEAALSEFSSSKRTADESTHLLSAHFFQHDILHLAHLLTLFTFLTSSSISNVLSIYAATMSKLLTSPSGSTPAQKEGDFLHRLMSRDRLELLKFCQERQVFLARSTCLSLAMEDVRNHPDDAVLVENYYGFNATQSVRVGNDVMKLIYDENELHCLKLHHIKSLIKKIVSYSETGFQVESTINQLKSFFEICFNTQLKTCPLTWSLYLYFHNLVKDKQKSSTRMFYRAIEGLPGSKMLYMQSILYNPDMLIKIIKTMDSKEVRLRTFIEEVNLLMSSYKILHANFPDQDENVTNKM